MPAVLEPQLGEQGSEVVGALFRRKELERAALTGGHPFVREREQPIAERAIVDVVLNDGQADPRHAADPARPDAAVFVQLHWETAAAVVALESRSPLHGRYAVAFDATFCLLSAFWAMNFSVSSCASSSTIWTGGDFIR